MLEWMEFSSGANSLYYIYCKKANMFCLLGNFLEGLKGERSESELLPEKFLFDDKFTALTTFVQLQSITFDLLLNYRVGDTYLPLYKT